jgi:UTP--glucose-1-phosphate uridylyltransferase
LEPLIQIEMHINTAVIPAAGFGTRLLPITKSIPKEMLPILDKPVIQYLVEELVSAGITNIIIVVSDCKQAIKNHFKPNIELEKCLKDCNKLSTLKMIKGISKLAKITFIKQEAGYGNAIPIKSARHLLKNKPFLVLWGDIIADHSRSQQAVAAFEKYQKPILCGTLTTDPNDASTFGFVDGKKISGDIWKVKGLVEKPGLSNLPSNLAVYSGYILTPSIFPILEKLKPSADGEYYLTAAINELAKKEEVLAIEMKDTKQYDIGNKLAYFKAFVEYGLKDEVIKEDARKFLKLKLAKSSIAK